MKLSLCVKLSPSMITAPQLMQLLFYPIMEPTHANKKSKKIWTSFLSFLPYYSVPSFSSRSRLTLYKGRSHHHPNFVKGETERKKKEEATYLRSLSKLMVKTAAPARVLGFFFLLQKAQFSPFARILEGSANLSFAC